MQKKMGRNHLYPSTLGASSGQGEGAAKKYAGLKTGKGLGTTAMNRPSD
jgi:hypothetical protein